jgi:AraC family transcriptional regulator
MKHILRRREVDGLGLSESLYQPHLRQPVHLHVLASFSFVLAGNYVETNAGGRQTRQPSTLVFHPPQELHAVEYKEEPVRILGVEIAPKRFSYLRERGVLFDGGASGRSETVAWLGRRLYQEFRIADDASSLAVEGLVMELFAEASRARALRETASPRWLNRAKDFLHDNFSESVRFDDLARTVGVHPVHLARVFRQKNGCTLGQYLRRLRLDFAAREIANTDAPLGEIAVAAGFADQSHLTKIFKAHFGSNPSEYRRTHRC